MIKDVADNITIPEGASIVLNVAEGVTLSGGSTKDSANKSHTITNYGTLEITGLGTLENMNSGSGVLFNNMGATADLNGCTFTGTPWYVLKNLGTMTINGATVQQQHAGSSAIDNGWYGNAANDCGVGYPTDGSVATLTIIDGTFDGGMNIVKNDDYGVLEIQNGNFTNTDGPTVLNWNVATIKGGTFKVNNDAASVIANGYLDDTMDKGQLTITGGTFTASNDGAGALFGYGVGSSKGGSFAITGGTFKGSLDIDDNYPYTPVVSGGAFSSKVPEEYCAKGYNPTNVDENGNYTVCSHNFEWVVDKEAVGIEDGLKHEECTICHATRNENTVIPVVPVNNGTVSYKVHVQTYGWQDWEENGATAGTEGEAKRLEGIELVVSDPDVSGGITYQTHVQTYGWQDWKNDGSLAGTEGDAQKTGSHKDHADGRSG